MYYFSISVNFSLDKFQQIPVTAGFLIRTPNQLPNPVVPKVLGSFTVFPNNNSSITGMSDFRHRTTPL